MRKIWNEQTKNSMNKAQWEKTARKTFLTVLIPYVVIVLSIGLIADMVLAEPKFENIKVCPAGGGGISCFFTNLFSTLFTVSSDATYLGTITCQSGATCRSDTACTSAYSPNDPSWDTTCISYFPTANQGTCTMSGTQPVLKCYYSSSGSTTPVPTPIPTPVCNPANFRCNGNTVEGCKSDGSGWSFVYDCNKDGKTCNADAAGAECVSTTPTPTPIGCAYNEFRCNENKQEWCNYNGQWEYIQTCRSGTYCYKSSSTMLDCKNTTPTVCGLGKKLCGESCIWTWQTCGTTPEPTKCSSIQKSCGDKCIYTWETCEGEGLFPLPDECKTGDWICMTPKEASDEGYSDCQTQKYREGEFILCNKEEGFVDPETKCLFNRCNEAPNECVVPDETSSLHKMLKPSDSACYKKGLGNKCIAFPNEYDCTKDYGIIMPIFGDKPDGCKGSVCTSYEKCLENRTEVKSKDDGMARCCEKEVTEVKERLSFDSKFYCGKEGDIESKCQIGFEECMVKTGSSVNCGIDRVVCEEQNIEQKYGILAVIFIAILLLKLIP